MNIRRLIPAFAAAALGILFASDIANAQATRTWVSGVGDDANPCSRTAPCKTFAGAISKTAAGGEINVLDPGGFGAVTITKAITISSEGNVAGVLVSATNGIIVNAGPNDAIVLRGLDIEGVNTGINGVRFLAGASLTVDNCQIRNFNGANGNGIEFVPSGAAELYVVDSSITRSGINVAGAGIQVRPSGSGFARVTIVNSSISDNNNGIRLDSTNTTGGIALAVSNSNISGNFGNGVTIIATTGVGAQAMVDQATAVGNGIGSGGAAMRVNGSGAMVRLANSNITGNQIGLAAAGGGQLLSYGNNRNDGNLSNGAPTGTIPQN